MTGELYTLRFWAQVIERSVQAAAACAAGLLAGGGLGILDVDWQSIGSVSGLAAISMALQSVASGRVGDDTPTLTNVTD